MKRMPNIALTIDEFDKIVEFRSFNREGGESIICESDKSDTLYKICYDRDNQEVIEMPDNKFKKILALYEMDPKYSAKILSTISVSGRLFGYEMSYDPKNTGLDKISLSREQTIHILKQTRNALEYYSRNGIVYGDVKGSNILVNRHTDTPIFCDLDNMQVGDYPIDLKGKELRYFENEYGTIDSNADIYMHNLLTLQQLGFPSRYTTMEGVILTLKNGTIPQSGFDKKAEEVFYSMINPKNFNGQYAIQYVRK